MPATVNRGHQQKTPPGFPSGALQVAHLQQVAERYVTRPWRRLAGEPGKDAADIEPITPRLRPSCAGLRPSAGPRLPPPPSSRMSGPSSRTNTLCEGRPLATCYIGG